MKGKMLYEKKFPKFELNEITEEFSPLPETDQLHMSFEKFYKKRVEPLCAVPIKEKIEKANAFINAAIDVSDIYEFDVEIVQYPNMVSVEYSFDIGVFFDELKPVLVMADNFLPEKSSLSSCVKIAIGKVPHQQGPQTNTLSYSEMLSRYFLVLVLHYHAIPFSPRQCRHNNPRHKALPYPPQTDHCRQRSE